MTKLMALVAVIAGSFVVQPALAANCTAPVSTNCTYTDAEGTRRICQLFVRNDTPTGGHTIICVENDGVYMDISG